MRDRREEVYAKIPVFGYNRKAPWLHFFSKVMAAAKNSHVYEDHIQNRFLSQKQLREQRREGARHAENLSQQRATFARLYRHCHPALSMGQQEGACERQKYGSTQPQSDLRPNRTPINKRVNLIEEVVFCFAITL